MADRATSNDHYHADHFITMSDLNRIIAGLSPQQLDQLRSRLSEQKANADGAHRSQITPRARGGDTAPLSFAQQRFWFLSQLEVDSASYNVSTAVRIIGDLDVSALNRSLDEIAERHEILRTTYRIEGDSPVQVINPFRPVELMLADLSDSDEREREAEAKRMVDEEAKRPFDLERGPMLRAFLVRLGTLQHILAISMHHLNCDKWSHGVFMRELVTLYESHRAGKPSQLPSMTIQYADFACWQRERVAGENLQQQLAYWKDKLSGAPATLELPTDHPRRRGQTARSARWPVVISSSLVGSLKALREQRGGTMFMVLLAAFKALLYRYAGQRDLVVGILSANRTRPEIEGLIGQFANTLALRTSITDETAIEELLDQVREVTLGAYAHQDLPFEKLVEQIAPEREIGRTPLFQVAFNLQKAPPLSFELKHLQLEPIEVDRIVSNLDLLLEMEEREDHIAGALEYNAEAFEPETVHSLVEFYLATLEKMASVAQWKIAQLSIPSALESRLQKARARNQKQTVAICSSFTAEPVQDSIEFWADYLELPLKTEVAPYNQVFQELLDPSSLFSRNRDGINVLMLRPEDWLSSAQAAGRRVDEELEANAQDFVRALRAASERAPTALLVCLCPASPALGVDTTRAERLLERELKGMANLDLITSSDIAQCYGLSQYYDAYGEQIAHLPFTQDFFNVIGTVIVRRILAAQHARYKVIVLDCDQTLWKGVCGEDGPSGIEIDVPRRALQEFAVRQHDAGKIICLCSKNYEQDVAEVFGQRRDMVLTQAHIVSSRINWQPKSENIKSLAEELDLGLDSFIFIDDDPVECAEVKANCPEVVTVQLPREQEIIPRFLNNLWLFDAPRATDEDKNRTLFYKQNIERDLFSKQSLSLAEFIAGLDLKVKISPVASNQSGRVAQLMVRTNQFNTSAVKHSESEVINLTSHQGQACSVVEVSDRFGDYGLVGAMLFRAEQGALKVDSMLLSCRVLGRGVEHRMISELGRIATESSLSRVDILCVPSGRNAVALNFFESVAAEYKESQGEAYLYRIPAQAACRVAFDPTAKETDLRVEAGRSDSASRPAASSGSLARHWSEQFCKIASEMYDAEQISRAISLSKQRSREDSQGEFIAPSTPIEEALAEIWSKLLGLDRVGVHDNFFRLGGHSLLGAVLMSRVRDLFQLELPLLTLFQTPTIAGLTEEIERRLIMQMDTDSISELLEDVEGLTQEAARELLKDQDPRLAKAVGQESQSGEQS